MFPPVPGGVVSDIRFIADDRILVAYYGGVTIWSADPEAPGMQLEYGVRRNDMLAHAANILHMFYEQLSADLVQCVHATDSAMLEMSVCLFVQSQFAPHADCMVQATRLDQAEA